MDWLAPAILIPATAVVAVLCARAVVRALRAEKAQDKELGSAQEKQDQPDLPQGG